MKRRKLIASSLVIAAASTSAAYPATAQKSKDTFNINVAGLDLSILNNFAEKLSPETIDMVAHNTATITSLLKYVMYGISFLVSKYVFLALVSSLRSLHKFVYKPRTYFDYLRNICVVINSLPLDDGDKKMLISVFASKFISLGLKDLKADQEMGNKLIVISSYGNSLLLRVLCDELRRVLPSTIPVNLETITMDSGRQSGKGLTLSRRILNIEQGKYSNDEQPASGILLLNYDDDPNKLTSSDLLRTSFMNFSSSYFKTLEAVLNKRIVETCSTHSGIRAVFSKDFFHKYKNFLSKPCGRCLECNHGTECCELKKVRLLNNEMLLDNLIISIGIKIEKYISDNDVAGSFFSKKRLIVDFDEQLLNSPQKTDVTDAIVVREEKNEKEEKDENN